MRLALPLCAAVALAAVARPAPSQPAYKLDVKANLKPEATLRLEGGRVRRSALKDDPGFRLQYHFRKDGKTVATPDARAKAAVDVPSQEPGTYTVVLELFYPGYKGGNQEKGEYRPVSNVLTYRVEPGAGPGRPGRVVAVAKPAAAPAPAKK